jgi:hypothetical protein
MTQEENDRHEVEERSQDRGSIRKRILRAVGFLPFLTPL